jgi:hypothetical protein
MPQTLPPIRADLLPQGLKLDRAALAERLAMLPPGAPVVALIHGYSFMPDLAGQCPHQHIFAVTPTILDNKVISWPRHLGLNGSGGLAIACGWPARGTLWRAHRRARAAGQALAELAAMVQDICPERRLDVVGHSLGARVVLQALHHANPGAFGRIILLAGAESRSEALAAIATPAGKAAQITNVTTRENDLFDALFEWLLHGGCRTSIGQGLPSKAPNWQDLWIDHPATRAALARLGHALPAPRGRVCHWSPYLRPGTFGLYRALLTGDLAQSALPRLQPTRRWSLLLTPRPHAIAP